MTASLLIIGVTLVAYYFIVVWLKRLEFMEYIPSGFTKWMLIFLLATLLDSGLGWALSEIKNVVDPAKVTQQKRTPTPNMLAEAIKCRTNPNLPYCALVHQQAEQALTHDLGGLS
jgi:hypothetical protein